MRIGVDQVRLRAVGAQHEWPQAPGRIAGDNDGAGAVSEHGNGAAVGPVEVARDDLRTDHEGVGETAGADQRVRGRERRDETGARVVQIERRRVRGPEQVGGARRCRRDDRVGCEGSHDQQVELLGMQTGVGERGTPGVRGELAQSRAGRRMSALGDPGTAHDPLLGHADRAREVLVADDALG